MAEISMLNPDTLGKPGAQYSHIARVKSSELAFIAGQIAVDKAGKLVGEGDFEAQCAQVFANIGAALESIGAGWGNVAQFTIYLVRAQDIPALRAYRQRTFSAMFPDAKYPPSTLLVIDQLASEQYLVEIQAIAAL